MNPVESAGGSEVDTSPLLVSTEEGGSSTGASSAATFADSIHLLPDVTGIHPNDEHDAQAQVPTSTQCFQSIKAKYSLYHVPLKVLVANVVSLILSQSLIHNVGDAERDFRYSNGSSSNDAYYSQFKTMVGAGLAISILTHLTNSYLLLRGARRLDGYMVENEDYENDGNTLAAVSGDGSEDDRDHPELRAYSRLSRRVDSTLGMARGAVATAPNQSFLVCLLYALCSLTIWKSTTDSTSLVQIQMLATTDIPDKGKCCAGGSVFDQKDFWEREGDRGIASLQQEPDFETNVPKDVQDWIRSHQRSWLGTSHPIPVFNRSLPYFNTVDGDLVFLKPVVTRSHGYYRRGREQDKAGVVVYASETKTAQTFVAKSLDNTTNDFYFWDDDKVDLVAFPSNDAPYTGWCAIFRSHGNNVLQDEVLCYNSKLSDGGTSSSLRDKMKRFDAVRDIKERWQGYGSGDFSLYGTDDTLWIASTREYSYWQSETEHFLISLISYDISKMEKNVTMIREVEDSRSYGRSRSRAARLADNPDCDGYATAIWVVSIVTLSLLTGLLYRLDVASSPVPACLTLWVILISILRNQEAVATILLACGCACLFLLVCVPRSNRNTKHNMWRYVSPEMAIWALYTFQFLAYWVFWSSTVTNHYFDFEDILATFPFPICSFLVAAASTVLLNHPFFQFLAVCFAGLSIVSLLFGFHGRHMLMVSVLLFAVSFGCFRMGTLFQVYRVHVIVIVRRVGRAWMGKCCKCRQTLSEPRNWLPLVLIVGMLSFFFNTFYGMDEEV